VLAVVEAVTKTCPKCGELKPLEEFYRRRRRVSDGRASHCKACASAYGKEHYQLPEVKERRQAQSRVHQQLWRAANPERSDANSRRWRLANPERERRRRRSELLKRHHDMTLEQYDAMLAAQGSVCANPGCRRPPNGRALHVDHDHAHDWAHDKPEQKSCPQCWRGLLCHGCNTAAGNLADDPERVDALAAYLRAHQRPELAEVTPTSPLGENT